MFSFCCYLLLIWVCYIDIVNCNYYFLPYYDCDSASSNYELGYCLGSKSVSQIKSRWDQWIMVQNLYEWIETTSNGTEIYNEFLKNNANKYPLYIDEIHGIADGSDFDFKKIFIMSCADEISYFAPHSNPELTCSDYQLKQINNGYIAHNEDNSAINGNNTFLVKSGSNIPNELLFYSYGYVGELLTQAIGWNNYIIFTSNFVHPTNPIQGGLCRNFIAREMMIQKTMNDVLNISATDGQCSGHNYQIGEWLTGNLSNSEVAYDALHKFTIINNNDNWTFHANMYIHLNISQYHDSSSIARETTAANLGKPKDLNEMLDFLGNQNNKTYPIYNSHNTLHTLGIDLFNQQIDIYAGNPIKRNMIYSCNTMQCQR